MHREGKLALLLLVGCCMLLCGQTLGAGPGLAAGDDPSASAEVGILGTSDTGDWTLSQYSKPVYSFGPPVWRPLTAPVVVRTTSTGVALTLKNSLIFRDPYGRLRSSSEMHGGVDLYATPKGLTKDEFGNTLDPVRTEVRAAYAGKVHVLSDPTGYGTYIKENLQYSDGEQGTDLCVIYGHLDSVVAGIDGTAVSKGQLIGYVGQTGNAASTYSHLHLELRSYDGTHWYDPEPYVAGISWGDAYSQSSWLKVTAPTSVSGTSFTATVTIKPVYYDPSAGKNSTTAPFHGDSCSHRL